jgi:hypothetical protein
MQTGQLPQQLQPYCDKIFAFSIAITLVTISLLLKQYKRLTFEMSVLALNGLCLTFVMWVAGYAKVPDILFILGLSGVLCLLVLWNFNPHRQRLRHIRNREDLPMEAIYSQFFTEANLPKGLVLELWNEVATLLRVPPGKLRPSDRFDKELAPGGVWLQLDSDAAEVNLAAQYRSKKLGIKTDFSAIQTLRDYIELFCKSELAKS